MESHGRKQIHVFPFNCAIIHYSLLDCQILFGCLRKNCVKQNEKDFLFYDLVLSNYPLMYSKGKECKCILSHCIEFRQLLYKLTCLNFQKVEFRDLCLIVY